MNLITRILNVFKNFQQFLSTKIQANSKIFMIKSEKSNKHIPTYFLLKILMLLNHAII